MNREWLRHCIGLGLNPLYINLESKALCAAMLCPEDACSPNDLSVRICQLLRGDLFYGYYFRDAQTLTTVY